VQNNAKVGGVLSIVAGAFGILGMLFCILIGIFVALMPRGLDGYYREAISPEGIKAVVAVFYIVWCFLGALVGALAIVGGVFALRKKHWGWALAGSIAGTLTFFPCGIPAIIFVSLGKPEFQAAVPPAPTAPTIG
jgi:hypothetical protein